MLEYKPSNCERQISKDIKHPKPAAHRTQYQRPADCEPRQCCTNQSRRVQEKVQLKQGQANWQLNLEGLFKDADAGDRVDQIVLPIYLHG